MADKNYFEILNGIDVGDKTEKKGQLTYLSWAWAWAELKKRYPNSTYTVYQDVNGMPYFTDGKTCMVKTGVTVEGIEHIEFLPIMDFKNKSIPYDTITSFDVNKAIQRSLTKAVARHGLGLYIYAGEDLPEEIAEQKNAELKAEVKKDRNFSLDRKTKATALASACGVEVSKITKRLADESMKLGHDLTDEEAVDILDKWLLEVANKR